MSNFKIAWMFPDTLFLHGERGNVLALERFARMASLEPEINKIDFDSKDFNPMDYQLMFFGPGEISSFESVREWLNPHKDALATFIESGRPLIATGTTVALFCKSILRCDGEKIEGLGVIDAEFIENEKVYGDDILFDANYCGRELEIIGNQIQMGNLILGSEQAFGRLRYGYGNTGKGRDEGAIKKSAIFTNALGPMLICNPQLSIEVVAQAAKASGIEFDEKSLRAYDDSLEQASFKTKENFINNKETHLENCR